MTTTQLPDDVLDADIAILGRKGGGKTYTAKGIVERLLDMKRRVLILDPLGVWAGLRTAADGEAPGYPVAIFGGAHADEPLDPALAIPLAQIIARENLPVVIDLSELAKTKQQSFLYAFLHELRRVNTEALTIVLEEADTFAPQNPMGDDSKLLHSEIDWICRRGRFRGFRLLTVTQRPARLSKDVLTQAGTLIAHRLPAPQDRDAVKAWVDGNGDRDKAKEVFDTLARLDVGEAWVWASDQDILERIKFPKIRTLDTSATPKAGEKRIEPKTLAQVDLGPIRAALKAAADEEKKPKKTAGDQAVAVVDEKAIEEAENRGYLKGIASGRRHITGVLHELRNDFDRYLAEAERLCEKAFDEITLAAEQPVDRGPVPVPADYPVAFASEKSPPPPLRLSEGTLQGAATALLYAVARYPKDGLTWDEACIVACIVPGNGYFYKGKKSLIEGGYVTDDNGVARITDRGRQLVANPGGPMSRQEIIAQWASKVGAPGGPMLQHIGRRAGWISTDDLAAALNMKPGNGYWYKGAKAIRNANLIEQVNGTFRLSEFVRSAP